MNKKHVSDRVVSIFLISIILAEFLLIAALVFGQRLALHDSFFRLCVQYFLMNNAVFHGEPAQWVPYLTHGATALPFYSAYSVNGLLLYGLTLVASLLEPINFLLISYAGIFVDKLILLCGVLLLANLYFSSRLTTVFVAASACASAIWLSQTYMNLHLIYGLPLLIYFFHRGIRDGRWALILWGLNFWLVQSLGQVAYFVPIVALTAFIYTVSLIVVEPLVVRKLLSKNSWDSQALIAGVALLATVAAVYCLWSGGIANDNIFRTLSGRNPDGSVTLAQFLTYNGQFNFLSMFELIWGMSIARDYTFYIGALSVVMVIAGILNLERRHLPLIVTAVGILLICAGTFAAVIVYYGWPLMKYFRHLHLMLPIVRLFLCFIAGIGFEALTQDSKFCNSRRWKLLLAVVGVLIITLLTLASSPSLILMLTKAMGFSSVKDPGLLIQQSILQAVKFMLIAAALVALRLRFMVPLVIIALTTLSFLDVYAYAASEYVKRSTKLTSAQYEQFYFVRPRYQLRRQLFDWHANPRFQIFSKKLLQTSAHYYTVNALTLIDTLDTPLRTEYCQRSFAEYLSARQGTNIFTTINGVTNVITMNADDALIGQWSGVTEDKIQFFRNAYVLKSVKDMAAQMSNLEVNNLFLLVSPGKPMPPLTTVLSSREVQDSARLSVPYDVDHFSANDLRVKAHVTGTQPVWMFYSDAWDPQWTVTINGIRQKVYRAQFAYKSVLLQPGTNVVCFHYGSWWVNLSLFFLGLVSWGWIAFCLKLLATGTYFRKQDTL